MTSSLPLRTAFGVALFLASSPVLAQEKKKVVTTVPILASLTREIAGDLVDVDSLSDARQDPHFVQPRPTLMKKVRSADLFIQIGLQMELWVQRVIEGAANSKVFLGQPGHLIASSGISTLQIPRAISRELGDIHPAGNPHLWLDPLRTIQLATNIHGALKMVDPANAAGFDQGLARFKARIIQALFGDSLVDSLGGDKLLRLTQQNLLLDYLKKKGLLDQLEGWMKTSLPLRDLNFVSYHQNWIYFTERFGGTVVAEVEERPGIPPSARHRDNVIDIIRQRDVKIILMASYYSSRACDYIAERTGARVVALPLDLDPHQGARDYFAFVDLLLTRILEASPSPSDG